VQKPSTQLKYVFVFQNDTGACFLQNKKPGPDEAPALFSPPEEVSFFPLIPVSRDLRLALRIRDS